MTFCLRLEVQCSSQSLVAVQQQYQHLILLEFYGSYMIKKCRRKAWRGSAAQNLVIYLFLFVLDVCCCSSPPKIANAERMTSAIIDSTNVQVSYDVGQESIIAADLAERRRLLTLLRRAEAARDRYHKKKAAKAPACPSGPTEASLSSSASGT